MPKNIEDIIPSGKRTIRNIPIPVRKERAKEVVVEAHEPSSGRMEQDDYSPRGRGGSRKGKWIGGGIGVLVLLFVIMAVQNGATLAYKPKTSALTFASDSYTAYQTPSDGQLPFSVIKLSGEKSVNVPATGEESANDKASGRVVIYNEQSSAQPLVKTTRLETADGKIYRIQEDVTVPAKGNIEVTAVADQPGSSYNIPLSDFTVPGFKGGPKYELVYARGKTPMSGGFIGMRKKVSEADLAKAKSSLEGTLKNELLSQARAQMPAEFILFPDLASVTFEFLPVESAGETNAKVTLRGNLSAAIFKRGELSEYLAAEKLGSQSDGGKVIIDEFSTLSVKPASSQASIGGSETLRIEVGGTAILRFLTDEVALASDLVGVPKKNIDSILKQYPSIDSASAVVRPFWKSTFPNDVSKIKIEKR